MQPLHRGRCLLAGVHVLHLGKRVLTLKQCNPFCFFFWALLTLFCFHCLSVMHLMQPLHRGRSLLDTVHVRHLGSCLLIL